MILSKLFGRQLIWTVVLYVYWFTTYCTIIIHTYTVSLIIVHSTPQSFTESRLQSRGLELPTNPLQHPNSSQLLPCPLHAGRIKPFCHCDCHWVNPLYLPLLGVGLVTGLYVLLTMYQERWLSLKLEFQMEILEGACVLLACLQYLWRHYRFIGNSTSLNDINNHRQGVAHKLFHSADYTCNHFPQLWINCHEVHFSSFYSCLSQVPFTSSCTDSSHHKGLTISWMIPWTWHWLRLLEGFCGGRSAPVGRSRSEFPFLGGNDSAEFFRGELFVKCPGCIWDEVGPKFGRFVGEVSTERSHSALYSSCFGINLCSWQEQLQYSSRQVKSCWLSC